MQTPHASGTVVVTLVTLSTSRFSTWSLFLLYSSLGWLLWWWWWW